MKIRSGFVSNSSSSSFIIKKENLSEAQIGCIFNHTYVMRCEKLKMYNDEVCSKCDLRIKCELKSKDSSQETEYGWGDKWNIEDNNGNIEGTTFMDNFDMSLFLKNIGVKGEHVKWSSD